MSPDIKQVEPPAEIEIATMRAIDPAGIHLGSKSKLKDGTFDEFYMTLKEAYENAVVLI